MHAAGGARVLVHGLVGHLTAIDLAEKAIVKVRRQHCCLALGLHAHAIGPGLPRHVDLMAAPVAGLHPLKLVGRVRFELVFVTTELH